MLPLLIGTPGYVTGSIHGAMVVALLSIFAAAFLLDSGGGLLLAATYGEAYTGEQIHEAVNRGLAWGAVHNIEVGSSDIDHVVFAPSGVLAIDQGQPAK